MDGAILRIKIDNEEINLLDITMEMEQAVGEHVRGYIRGILSQNSEENHYNFSPKAKIEIYDREIDTILFRGIVKDVDLASESMQADPLRTMKISFVSASYLLDSSKPSRAFQDNSKDYQSIASKIMESYSSGDVMISDGLASRRVDKLLIQYQESDWEFLKRLMSRLSLEIYPNAYSYHTQIYAGLHPLSESYQIQEDEGDEIEEVLYLDERGNSLVELLWETERDDFIPRTIGDRILYEGASYYVRSSRLQVEDAVLSHRYTLSLESNLSMQTFRNESLVGLSLQGVVKKVSADKIQLGLDIDVYEDTNIWYPYSTFYSNFYCMPEKGDRVNLYIPSSREEEAFVLNSIREEMEREEEWSGTSTASLGFQDSHDQHENIENEEEAEEGIAEIDILTWLGQLSNLPDSEIKMIAVGTSELEDDGDTETAEPIENSTGNQVSSSQGISTGSTGGGRKSTQPNFDFQNLHDNEAVKVLSTKDNKMIILDDQNGSITIRYSDGSFILLDDAGIQISSVAQINISTKGDINLSSQGSIAIAAKGMLSLDCGGSCIRMTPDAIGIQGADVKIN